MAQLASSQQDQPKGYAVKLYVYDLSGGLAKIYSPQLVGKVIEGIWHSSIALYEQEYFYGGGIQSARPKTTPYGQPVKEFDMGYTFIPQSVFHDFLREVSPKYSPDKYDLIHNNCNNFTNEASQFLLGKNIPDFITGLPQEFLQTPFGQMVQPIIQNMQNQALQNFGDYAGMGIAAEPHLPQVNPIYDKFVGESDAEDVEDLDQPDQAQKSSNDNNNNNNSNNNNSNNSNNSSNDADVVMTESSNNSNNNSSNSNNAEQSQRKDEEEKGQGASSSDASESKDSLFKLVNEYCSQHKNYGVNSQLKVIGKNEFYPKLTLDNANASLYAEMVVDSSEVENARQSAHISQLVKYIERKEAAKKKGMNIILQMSDDALEVLDELMLMSPDESLFPLIALLKLLMVYPRVLERYQDLMIVNQILYRIGIPFSDEEKDIDAMMNENNDNSNANASDEKESKENKSEKVPNIHLLQFNALCALSHLYTDALVEVKNNVIALGIAGLKIERTQVRLAATRLLFNMLLQCKRQYLMSKFGTSKDNRDADALKQNGDKIDKLVKQMIVIGRALSKHLDTETHEPGRYRCLVGLGVLFYCNENEDVTKNVKVNMDAWKERDSKTICSEVFADLALILS